MAGRTIRFTDAGEARFHEDIANGSSYVSLKAPASLAANRSFVLPAADGTPGQVISTDGAGNLSFTAGTGTLQSAYDNGKTITLVATAISLAQANNVGILSLTKTGVGAGIALDISNAGTGEALKVVQTGAGYALRVSRNLSAAVPIVSIESGASTDRPHLQIAANGASSAATGITLTQAANAVAISITQNGTAESISISHTNNARGFFLDKTHGGAADAAHIANAGTGSGLLIAQGTADGVPLRVTSARDFDTVQLVKTGTGSGDVIQIDDSGTGNSIDINKTGNGHSIDVFKSSAGAGRPITIDNDGTGIGIFITQDGAADAVDITQATDNRGIVLKKTGAGSGAALSIDNDGTGQGILVQQDGAARAIKILQNGNDKAMEIAQVANDSVLLLNKTGVGAGVMLEISNSGTGRDVQGNGSDWFVENGGHARLTTLRTPLKTTLTIAAGVVTKSGGYHLIAGQGGVADDLDTIDGGTTGDWLVLRAASDTVDITIKNLTGNIASGADFIMNSDKDIVVLFFVGTVWYAMVLQNNG